MRSVTIGLFALALGLPILQVLLYWVSKLLGAMQDHSGAAVLDRISLAIAILWAASLVAMLLLLALKSFGPPDGTPDP